MFTYRDNIEGWVWDYFDTSPPMSTYLVACVITHYAYVERHYVACKRTVTMRFWADSEKLAQLNLAADLAPKVFHFLDAYLQLAYPMPKLDIIAVPGYDDMRAMENWGLIIHRYAIQYIRRLCIG